MNKYFTSPISIFNNLTKKYYEKGEYLYPSLHSSITVSLDENSIVSSKDESGVINVGKIFQIFDKEVLWDFGDGTTMKGLTATHSYSTPGFYKISCICFDKNGDAFYNNIAQDNSIIVEDILQTVLKFTPSFIKEVENGLFDNVYAGEKFKVAKLHTTLKKSIGINTPIKCTNQNSNTTNLFDIDINTPYIHLLPYNTFSDENNPTNSIEIKYFTIYSLLESIDNVIINLYILNDSGEDIDELTLLSLNESLTDTVKITEIRDISEIPSLNYEEIGYCGVNNIFYQDDLSCDSVLLNFALDNEYFETTNSIIDMKSVNLVSIGLSCNIKPNTDIDVIPFISTNGLTTSTNILDNTIDSNIYSFNRAKYVNHDDQFVIRLIANTNNPYFIKDIELNLQSTLLSPVDVGEITYFTNDYNKFGSITGSFVPKKEQPEGFTSIEFILELIYSNGIKKEVTLLVSDLTCIDIENFYNKDSEYFLNVTSNLPNYDFNTLWKIYKTHPSFFVTPNLDKIMTAILGDDTMSNIVNKGIGFVDDITNPNTCYIKNLISILENIDVDVEKFDGTNFSEPNVINELIRILSIKHSHLIGSKVIPKNDFLTENLSHGINLGQKLNLSTKIYINRDKNTVITDKIVLLDKFSKKYKLLPLALLDNIMNKPFKFDSVGEYIELSDYTKYWGWNINLSTEKTEDLEKYYEFYIYIPTLDKEYMNSFLNPDNISDNISNYEKWNKNDGSMERLLQKTILENIDT